MNILTKVEKNSLMEMGCKKSAVDENWKKYLSSSNSKKLVVALDNDDKSRILLDVVENNIELFIKGLQDTIETLDIQETFVLVPTEKKNIYNKLPEKAKGMEISIVHSDFADPIYYKGAIFHNPATIVDIGKIADEKYSNETYISVEKDGEAESIRSVAFGTSFSEIIDTSKDDIKAIKIGNHLYSSDILETDITPYMPLGDHVVRVLKKDTCIVTLVQDQLKEYMKTSCGKCTFCREGLLLLHSYASEITQNKGKIENIDFLKEIAETMEGSSLCSVGLQGGKLTLDSISLFEQEYKDHIKKKKCDAGVCTSFISIYIDPDDCTGCMDCVDVCPVDCIDGKSNYIHMIDEFDCIKCGKCIDACEEDAIIKTEGKVPKLPRRLTKVGKFK
ncbi:MAG: NADH-ubiquinone oxidoreductase-F iron-sulfur binding region domain-containing protein [Eubacteriales bacterium]